MTAMGVVYEPAAEAAALGPAPTAAEAATLGLGPTAAEAAGHCLVPKAAEAGVAGLIPTPAEEAVAGLGPTAAEAGPAAAAHREGGQGRSVEASGAAGFLLLRRRGRGRAGRRGPPWR
jgi:hypothetical protein